MHTSRRFGSRTAALTLSVLAIGIAIAGFGRGWIWLVCHPLVELLVASLRPTPVTAPVSTTASSLSTVAWAHSLGGSGQFFGIYGAHAYVYNAYANAVQIIRLADGEVERQQAVDQPPQIGVANHVLVVGEGHTIRGLDSEDLSVRWEVTGVMYTKLAGDRVYGVTYDDDSRTTLVSAIAVGDGHILWQHMVDGPAILRWPSPGGSQPVLLELDRNAVLALHADDGHELWRYQATCTEGPCQSVIKHADAESVYLVDKGLLCRLATANGQQLWCTQKPPGPIGLTNDRIFSRPEAGRAEIIDGKTGKVIWTLDRSEFVELPYRCGKLSVIDGVACFTLADDMHILYAVDMNDARLLWKSTLPIVMLDVEAAASTERHLYFRNSGLLGSFLGLVDKATGEYIGRVNDVVDSIEHVTVDGERIYIIGEGRQSSLIGGRRWASKEGLYLTAFGHEPAEEVATRALQWWQTGERASGLRTIELVLREVSPAAALPPIVEACRQIVGGELELARAAFNEGKYYEALNALARSDNPIIPLARQCPGANDLLAQSYMLAGKAHAAREAAMPGTENWFAQPVDNPYFDELIRELPDSPEAIVIQAEQGRLSREFVLTRERQRLPLVVAGMAMPLLVLGIGLRKGWRWAVGRLAFGLLIVNVLGGGLLFDMLFSDMRQLRPSWWGANLQLYQAMHCCLNCVALPCIVKFASLAAKAYRSAFVPFALTACVIDAVVMFWLLISAFLPLSF